MDYYKILFTKVISVEEKNSFEVLLSVTSKVEIKFQMILSSAFLTEEDGSTSHWCSWWGSEKS